MCLLPARPGSLAARPAKQAGKCVYKLFKLWINFSGVCVCVSPHVVIFQKSGLLEIFSLKLERNLNSLRAGGSRLGGRPGGSAGFPAHGRGEQLRGRAAGGKGGWRCEIEHLSAAVGKRASAGPRCPAAPPRPLQRAPEHGGGQSRFPGISRGKGDSHPAEGCEERCGAPEKESGGGVSWARVGEIKRGQFRHTWGSFPL